MKKYYKGYSESSLGAGTIYSEFEGESAIRQVENYGETWLSSRQEYNEGVGLGLYDGKLSDLDLSDTVEIEKQEFEEVWAKADN